MEQFNILNDDGTVVGFEEHPSGFVRLESYLRGNHYMVVDDQKNVIQWTPALEQDLFKEAIRNAGYNFEFVSKFELFRNGELFMSFDDELTAYMFLDDLETSHDCEIRLVWDKGSPLEGITRNERGFFDLVIAGDYKLSIQASDAHYCIPKMNLPNLSGYSAMEVLVFNKWGESINPRLSSVFRNFPRWGELKSHVQPGNRLFSWTPKGLIKELVLYLEKR